jgi:hypothetical protein
LAGVPLKVTPKLPGGRGILHEDTMFSENLMADDPVRLSLTKWKKERCGTYIPKAPPFDRALFSKVVEFGVCAHIFFTYTCMFTHAKIYLYIILVY